MTARPTAEQTRELANRHLRYEITMAGGLAHRFLHLREILNDPAKALSLRDTLSEIGRNADIEAFAIHARALLDFFYTDVRRNRRAIAADFFEDDAQWSNIRPEKTDTLKTVPGRAGAEIAHLSYRRKHPSTDWPYTAIWRDLVPLIELFLEYANEDRLGSSFVSEMRDLISQLNAPIDRRLASLYATTAPPPSFIGDEQFFKISVGPSTATFLPRGRLPSSG